MCTCQNRSRAVLTLTSVTIYVIGHTLEVIIFNRKLSDFTAEKLLCIAKVCKESQVNRPNFADIKTSLLVIAHILAVICLNYEQYS